MSQPLSWFEYTAKAWAALVAVFLAALLVWEAPVAEALIVAAAVAAAVYWIPRGPHP